MLCSVRCPAAGFAITEFGPSDECEQASPSKQVLPTGVDLSDKTMTKLDYCRAFVINDTLLCFCVLLPFGFVVINDQSVANEPDIENAVGHILTQQHREPENIIIQLREVRCSMHTCVFVCW
jgi:hypothetical protein